MTEPNVKMRAIPFVPVVKIGQDEPSQVASQLSRLMADYERNGWRFVRLETVHVERNNGCIAGLLSLVWLARAFTQVTHQVVILEWVGKPARG